MTIESHAETPALRTLLRDLVALSTIPAMWVGREPAVIAAELADVLSGSLHLDFAFVRLCDPKGGGAIEVTRGNAWKTFPEWLGTNLGGVGQFSCKEIVTDLGGAEPCRGVVIPIGVNAEGGLVAAACIRTDFPSEIDQLLLSVAANHAAAAFQNARLRDELDAKLAELSQARNGLEMKVAERTADLRRLCADLEQREAKIRRLVEANIVGIFIWEIEGRILDANDEFLRIVGCDRDDLKSGRMRWTDLAPPEWLELDTRQRLPELKATGSVQPFEKEYFRKDGSRVPVLIGVTSFEETGNQGVAFVLDLSEQKRSEETLRRSEAYLAEAQRLSHTGSFGWNASSGGIYWSEETFRIFEFEPATQPTLEQVFERIHPEDRHFVRQVIGSATEKRMEFDIEHRLLMPDTSVKYVRVVGQPSTKDESGKLEFVGAVTDITERKRAQEKLRETETRLQAFFKHSPNLIFMKDPQGRYLYVNQEVERVLRLTEEQIKGKRDDEVFPQEQGAAYQAAAYQANDRQVLQAGTPMEFEEIFVKEDGPHTTIVHKFPLFNAEGAIYAIGGVATDITERKREESARRYTEERYRLVVETANDAVVSMDEGGTILFANPATATVFGYDPTELIGKPLTMLMPEYMRELHNNGFRRYLATGQRHIHWQGTEFTALHKNGKEFPVEVSFGELTRDGHKVFTGFLRDISEKKKAEEALRRSQSYLAQAQQLAHIGSWAWEIPSRNAIYISEEWYRIYGFDPKSGMLNWEQRLQRIHPEDRGRFQETIDQAIAEKSDYDLEFRILTPHSPERHIHSVGHPVLGPSGELVQFIGVSMDVTESKQAQEAFRLMVVGTAATTGSDFFQSLVQHMARVLRARYAFVTTCDDQKHARTLAFCKGDGLGENFEFDIVDTPCEKVLHGALCHYQQGLRDLFPLDKILADWEAESYLGLPMLDGSNRVIGHMAILDDRPMEADCRAIDLLKIFASRAAAELKRQRAEDELQAALQERERLRRVQAELAHINRVSTMGELTASLAHEIKQPIGAAVTNAEACLRLLDRDQPDVAEAREAVLEMVRDARRAAAIIDRVRSLYRKGSSQLEVVDVNEVIGEMALMLQNEANRHSVTIRTEVAKSLPGVMADRVQLQQVLMNLMLNGIEAMQGTTGELSIKSQLAEDGQLLISVTDTGVGLPSGNLDRIFDAFFTTKSQGTGLGLAITRSIVESHGGRVWATANSGRGASFHFTLPSRVAMSA